MGVAREMTDAAIQSEYDTLFGGMSKPEVYLYGSHFLSGFLNEKPLARLRTELANLGPGWEAGGWGGEPGLRGRGTRCATPPVI